MLMTWNEDQIRFMEDASRKGAYYKDLADLLVPHLQGCRSVCDAGCGLGQLAEELGRRGYEAIAADSSESAISYIAKKNPSNVTPLLTDLRTFEGPKFDAMVFHYFGSMEETLEMGNRLSKGPIIVIKKNYDHHRFSLSKQPIHGYTGKLAEDYLRERNIPYEKELFEAEMGQPFRSVEDALLFFQIYSKDDDRSLICRTQVESRLVTTGDKEFPYYLPQKKSSVVLTLKL